jgi:hypothetical protein
VTFDNETNSAAAGIVNCGSACAFCWVNLLEPNLEIEALIRDVDCGKHYLSVANGATGRPVSPVRLPSGKSAQL